MYNLKNQRLIVFKAFLLTASLFATQAFGVNVASVRAKEVTQALAGHGYSDSCPNGLVKLRQDITNWGNQSAGIFIRECAGKNQLIKMVPVYYTEHIRKYAVQKNHAESLGLIRDLKKNNIEIVFAVNHEELLVEINGILYTVLIYPFVPVKNLRELTEELGTSPHQNFYSNEQLNTYRRAYEKFGQAMATMYTKSLHNYPGEDTDYNRLFCIADAQKKNVMYDEKSDSLFFVDTIDESSIKVFPDGQEILLPNGNLCSTIIGHLSVILPKHDSPYHLAFAGRGDKYFMQYLAFFFESFKTGYFKTAYKLGSFTIYEHQFDEMTRSNMAERFELSEYLSTRFKDYETYRYNDAVNDFKQWVNNNSKTE